MSVHQDSKGRWFAKWYEDKKERRKYFGRGDIAEAKANEHDEQQKLQKQQLADTGKTVAEICQQYHLHRQREASTVETDHYRLTATILPRLGAIYAEIINSDHLNKYVSARFADGVKRPTIAREISILKAAMSWAEKQNPPLILHNAVAKYQIPKARDYDVPIPPNRREIEKLVAVSPQHLTRAILLQWFTGARPGREINSLRWHQVDFDAGIIYVVSAKKGGLDKREVPMKSQAKQTLARWFNEDMQAKPEKMDIGMVPVAHFRWQPAQSMKRSWKTAKQKAGITRRLRLYDIRHAFATYILGSGGDLKSVSNIMGHSREDTTVRMYQHVNMEHKRTAIELMPDLTIVSLLGSDTKSSKPLNDK